VTWETLAGGKGLTTGKALTLEDGLTAEITAVLEGPRRLVRFAEPVENHLPMVGHTPLPPYIHTPLTNPERYQTVYARTPGSAAAPTAGLHFTPRLIESLRAQGVQFAAVTLHVGLDTFAPVTEDSPQEHRIHSEWCELPPATADAVNAARAAGGRVIAVGTTSVRTLESAAAASPRGEIQPFSGSTSLYILPGFTFLAVDGMITNFHLPKSTLIMLVSAFAGRKKVLDAYLAARQAGYRFYSFGDAMAILGLPPWEESA
jgi:S-adenosylmethionine:tRNA ribosyltransferase-isomerase